MGLRSGAAHGGDPRAVRRHGPHLRDLRHDVRGAVAWSGRRLRRHLHVTNFVAFRNILLNGTEEQARHFVEKTEAGGFAAFCLTEANAGSDVAAMRTTAVLDGDEYVLNGTKTFITNGSISDIYVVFAKTDPEAGAHGITGFLIDGDTPGLAAGAKEHKMGFRLSDTTEVVLENVRVPQSAVIGKWARACPSL
ncbi:MAG: acyl-CoA dehydrogenase family protein [Adlercreutzia equolifaciens]